MAKTNTAQFATSDFNYDLPESLIAQHPPKNRGDSRLMVLNPNRKSIQHQQFADLLSYLRAGDLVIVNNSQVIPARLYGQKETGGKVELLVERILQSHQALCHIKASKAPKAGSSIFLSLTQQALYPREIELKVIEKNTNGLYLVESLIHPIEQILETVGEIPLPLYIERAPEVKDSSRYQTVYADPKGSVAAPTAGLHFDQKMITALAENAIDFAALTLHVGAGTFQPVRVDNIAEHKMHHEHFEVTKQLCDKIQQTKVNGGRVIAIGTTVVRALESAALSGELRPYAGETDIFIYPGFEFKVVDALLTNFHLPKSTLLMLISAFAGIAFTKQAYLAAVEQQYRFFSYGDAMFITGKINEI